MVPSSIEHLIRRLYLEVFGLLHSTTTLLSSSLLSVWRCVHRFVASKATLQKRESDGFPIPPHLSVAGILLQLIVLVERDLRNGKQTVRL